MPNQYWSEMATFVGALKSCDNDGQIAGATEPPKHRTLHTMSYNASYHERGICRQGFGPCHAASMCATGFKVRIDNGELAKLGFSIFQPRADTA